MRSPLDTRCAGVADMVCADIIPKSHSWEWHEAELNHDLPFRDFNRTREDFASHFSEGLNVRRLCMRFEVRFADPVLVKDEQRRIRMRLMQIVVDATRFRSSRREQTLKDFANARFVARFC